MVRHVTVNFVAGRAGESPNLRFRRVTCVVENAARIAARGLAGDQRLEVVMLGDVDAVEPEALAALDRGGCRLHRPQKLYDDLADQFPRLITSLGGRYSLFGFAFLRWLLIDALFPDEPVLCYDGDIMHNVPLPDLAAAFDGITTTATSTAFASIFDRAWFAAWRRALTAFDRDVAGFLARRVEPAMPPGCDFRRNPEEFLAKILIEAGELPQDTMPADFPYWIVPQPQMLPRLYNFVRTRGAPERVPTPMRYRRRDGLDLINDRPVAFWHLQKPFLSQLAALAILRKEAPKRRPPRIPPLSLYGRLPNLAELRMGDPYYDEGGTPVPPEGLAGMAERFVELERRAWSAGGPLRANPFSPAHLGDHYFDRHDLSLVFDDAVWPAAGVWASDQASIPA